MSIISDKHNIKFNCYTMEVLFVLLNVSNLRKKKLEAQNLIENMNLKEGKCKLDEYKKLYSYDMDIEIMNSIICFYDRNYKKAKEILQKIYYKYEYNSEVNFNLGTIYFYNNEFKEALYFLNKSKILDPTKADYVDTMVDTIVKELGNDVVSACIDKLKNYFKNSQRNFPKSNQYCNFIDSGYNKNFYCGIYDHYYLERDGINIDNTVELSNMLKNEIIPAHELYKFNLIAEDKIIIPIMTKKHFQKINISINGSENKLNYLIARRFYYYTVNKGDNVCISSDEKFILGENITCKKNDKIPSLILNIFVDGLSQTFIKENGLENLVPNIYNFFKEGTTCQNSYVTGEWTYVNLASFFTGKQIVNHRVFNPKYNTNNLYNQKLYSEIFNEQGYHCAKIDGDWRSNPYMGYMKGLDRYLYQTSIRGMHIDDIVMESIEHMEAFKDTNNYMWICVPDLHDVADEFETRISTQVNSSIQCRAFNKSDETSVRKKKDPTKIERYKIQLKRIDTYLGLLFNYIKQNYKDEDFIVSLFSDHGQGYLLKSDQFMDEERIKVPMMFRGKNIPHGECNELIAGLDLHSIILNSINLKTNITNDSNIPKYFGGKNSREYVYSESIFPGSVYNVSINDKTHKFFFNSIDVCTEDGRVKLDKFETRLINKQTGEEESSLYTEKIDKYIKKVFSHMKEYIII